MKTTIGKRKIDRIDSRPDTYKHIQTVQKYLGRCISELNSRLINHDQSKLVEPELSVFNEYTPKLKETTYGSEEYKEHLKGMEVGLNSHYSKNSHHPQFYTPSLDPDYYRLKQTRDVIEFNYTGEWTTDAVAIMDADLASRASSIRCMSLIDILEMLVDWRAACERMSDGNIRKSIELNQKRFGYTDELKNILYNTLDIIEAEDVSSNV